MIPIIREAYTAEGEYAYSLEHRCDSCSAQYRVAVQARGTGRAKQRLIDRPGETQARSVEYARKQSRAFAEKAVVLAPCPACGMRRKNARVRYLAGTAVQTLGTPSRCVTVRTHA